MTAEQEKLRAILVFLELLVIGMCARYYYYFVVVVFSFSSSIFEKRLKKKEK
jgi:hypothetical protein